MDTGNLSPHNIEAEEAILGCILMNPDVMLEVAPILQSSDFFLVKNGWIYAALVDMFAAKIEMDTLTISEELKRRKTNGSSQLDLVGGVAYLMQLSAAMPTWIHARVYGEIVARAATRRRLLSAASDIAQTALQENVEIADVIEHAENVLLEATARRTSDETITMNSLIRALYDDVEYRSEHPDEPRGRATGLPSLDEQLGGGAQNGNLIIIAARPGLGKTALAMNIALAGAKMGTRYGIFSLEMTPTQLAERMAANEANLNARRFRAGNLDSREWQQFTGAVARLERLPVFFESANKLTDVVNAARKLRTQRGIQALVIDYLQLMVNCKPEHETVEVGRITRRLKLLALELDIPIFLLSQLNRNVEARQNKRPQLADLRQSGAIEQDADVVIFIYRDVMYNENAPVDAAELIIAKQRDGETGMVPLKFSANVTRFYEEKSKPIIYPGNLRGNGYAHEGDDL